MPDIKKSIIVPYTASQMFKLVNSIEDYPHFIPYCQAANIISRNEDEIKATLDFAKGALHKSFTTHNLLQKDKMIEIRLLKGPFRHLEGFWRFDQLPDNSCEIDFDLEFEFANRLLGLAFEPLFIQIASKLVDAFKKRADVIYGGFSV